MFDFIAAYGAIFWGCLALLMSAVIVAVIVVELIDWLFVDPITRKSIDRLVTEDDATFNESQED